MHLDSSLVAAVGLGIAYAALPGVVNTEAVRRGMRGGFKAALLVQVGALIGDATWAVIALAGASVLLRYDAFGLALGVLGAGFLFNLARKAIVGAWRGTAQEAVATRRRPIVLRLVRFSLANPRISFRTGTGGGMLSASGENPSLPDRLRAPGRVRPGGAGVGFRHGGARGLGTALRDTGGFSRHRRIVRAGARMFRGRGSSGRRCNATGGG